MTSLQVKGPRKGNPDAVSFHKTFQRSQGHELSEFLVKIHLGAKLAEASRSVSGKSLLRVKTHMSQTLSGDNVTERDDAKEKLKQTSPSTENLLPGLRLDSDEQVALWPKEDGATWNGTQQTMATPQEHIQQAQKELLDTSRTLPNQAPLSDSESELEILEVRTVPKVNDTDSDSDDSDISSLDEQLNHALTSTTTAPTQSPKAPRSGTAAWRAILPTLYKPVIARTSPPPPGYRNIPSNLVNAIQRELNLFFDTGGDDELEVVGRVIFSLKDPYSATKIKLPVKATTCRHFECFDLENFSVFHKLAPGITRGLKKELVMKSHESRKLEQLFMKQQQQISNGTLLFKAPGLIYPQFSEHGQMFFSDVYNRTPPLYKCPLCDEKFGLKQLYISDIFNFFVKTTPLSTTRIELVETDRYRILEEESADNHDEASDLVVLSEDDDSDDDKRVKNEHEPKQERVDPANKSFSAEDFNDGLDDVLLKISQGDGTWGNPMTLD